MCVLIRIKIIVHPLNTESAMKKLEETNTLVVCTVASP